MKTKYSKEESEIIERVRSGVHFKRIYDDCPKNIRPNVKEAMDACLHLIQEEFGTAFIVSANGKTIFFKKKLIDW